MDFRTPVQVRMVGVEAAGEGVDTDKHAATLTMGSPGVLHGSFSYLLQDSEGQIIDPHSISAGCEGFSVDPASGHSLQALQPETPALTCQA